MIVTETYQTNADGTVLIRTYSDIGMYIERDGVQYVDAIDPINTGRVYTETNIPIPVEITEDVEEGEAEAEDEAEAEAE